MDLYSCFVRYKERSHMGLRDVIRVILCATMQHIIELYLPFRYRAWCFSLLTSYELLTASKIVDKVINNYRNNEIWSNKCINIMVNVNILLKPYETTSRKIFSLVLIA